MMLLCRHEQCRKGRAGACGARGKLNNKQCVSPHEYLIILVAVVVIVVLIAASHVLWLCHPLPLPLTPNYLHLILSPAIPLLPRGVASIMHSPSPAKRFGSNF